VREEEEREEARAVDGEEEEGDGCRGFHEDPCDLSVYEENAVLVLWREATKWRVYEE